jgi:hypothetical protein
MQAVVRSVRRLLFVLRDSPRREHAFLVRAACLAPIVELSLASVGLQRTRGWLDELPRARSVARVARQPCSLHEAERAVGRAFRIQPWLAGRCLARALVQYALHRRDGIRARLVIGVRRPREAELDAHAWVEAPDGPARYPHAPIFTLEPE